MTHAIQRIRFARVVIGLLGAFLLLFDSPFGRSDAPLVTEQELHEAMDYIVQQCEAEMALEQFYNGLVAISPNPEQLPKNTTMRECLDTESEAFAKLRNRYAAEHPKLVVDCIRELRESAATLVATFQQMSDDRLEESSYPDLANYGVSYQGILKCVEDRETAIDNLSALMDNPPEE